MVLLHDHLDALLADSGENGVNIAGQFGFCNAHRHLVSIIPIFSPVVFLGRTLNPGPALTKSMFGYLLPPHTKLKLNRLHGNCLCRAVFEGDSHGFSSVAASLIRQTIFGASGNRGMLNN